MKLIFKTKLSKKEVLERIVSIVRNEKSSELRPSVGLNTKLFIGNVGEDNFDIRRFYENKTLLSPRILGEILNGHPDTKIKLNITMQPLQSMSLIFVGGIFSVVCIATTIEMLGGNFNFLFLTPHLILIFGIIYVQYSFRLEVESSKNYLGEILDAEEIE